MHAGAMGVMAPLSSVRPMRVAERLGPGARRLGPGGSAQRRLGRIVDRLRNMAKVISMSRTFTCHMLMYVVMCREASHSLEAALYDKTLTTLCHIVASYHTQVVSNRWHGPPSFLQRRVVS